MPDRLYVPFLVLVVLVLVDLLVKVIALGLVPERRRAAAGTAWLLVIFFVPLVGLVVFGLAGGRALRRRPRVQTEAQAGMIVLHNNTYPPLPAEATGPDWLRGVLALNAKLGWLDPVAGTRVQLYADDHAVTAAMVAAVAEAKRFVHLECAALTWDDITEPLVTALVAARQRGVCVRLSYDAKASARHPGYPTLMTRLDGSGVERPTAPAARHSHRNLLVVDGRVAFGGSSLRTPTNAGSGPASNGRRGPELAFRVDGPLAHSLSVVFAADWYLERAEQLPRELLTMPPAYRDGVVGQVLASGPGLPSGNQLPMITSLVYGARSRLAMTCPFLVPDDSLLAALATAVRRGVLVELFVGTESDDKVRQRAQRSGYAALLEAGVRIFRHPGALAARHLTVDDAVAVVGSSSQDGSAVSVLLLSTEVVDWIRAIEDGYRAASSEIIPAAWRKRPLPQRYLDNALRVVFALR